jgi:5-methylcytosine-specific restriction endonuclease McrA
MLPTHHVTNLADAALHSELKRLTGSSNALTAQLLAHLGELEARGIYRERACSSLYTYCVYELRLSEDEAQRRCRAARLARQFPVLLDMLQDASIHLTGILLLGPHLTPENQAELLPRARYRTKRELERLIAEIAPCSDVATSLQPCDEPRPAERSFEAEPLIVEKRPRATWAAVVRALAGPVRHLQTGLGRDQAPPPPDLEESTIDPASPLFTGTKTRSTPPLPVSSRSEQPSGPRYRVQFTADQAYLDLLERARDLLQHELPNRDLVEVQRRALELLVEKRLKSKCATTDRPRSPKPAAKPSKRTKDTRYIPAAVRRAVWQRDQACCAYVDERGQRCAETAGLEFHHQDPHAHGGPATEANIALRCRAHNDLAAEHDFGRTFILRHRQRNTEPRQRGSECHQSLDERPG